MDRRNQAVFALVLLASLASACLVTNPSFDGPAPAGSTTASSLTGLASTSSSSSTASATSPTSADPTSTGSSDAASTFGVDSTSSTSSGADTSTSTGAAATDTDGSTGEDTEVLATTGEDEDSLVLEASRTYVPQAKEYPGVLTLANPTPVQLPATLMVTVGNAGNHGSTLTLTLPTKEEVECTYKGGSNLPDPVPDNPAEWDKGLSALFSGCSDGSKPGDMRTVIKLRLNITNGASMQPPGKPKTTVIAVLPKMG